MADAPDGEWIASLVSGLFGWGEPGGTEDAFWAVRKMFEHVARANRVALRGAYQRRGAPQMPRRVNPSSAK